VFLVAALMVGTGCPPYGMMRRVDGSPVHAFNDRVHDAVGICRLDAWTASRPPYDMPRAV